MSNQYYSTYQTGFSEVVVEHLPKALKNVSISEQYDGLVFYTTSSDSKSINRVRFLNNNFILVKKFNQLSQLPIENMLQTLLEDKQIHQRLPRIAPKRKKFRIRTAIANQTVAVDKNLMRRVEEKISQLTGNHIDRSLPDIEFWISARTEGFGIIGIRISQRPNYEKTLHKGELNPELAHIMCLLSQPDKTDVFLDPFAGYGSIPLQRSAFPAQKITALDKDKNALVEIRKKSKRNKLNIEIAKGDALKMSHLKAGSIDKIVTDPPWGFYKTENINLKKFYQQMFSEFIRLLKPQGLLVFASAQTQIVEKILGSQGSLKVLKTYTTLVSGKKATIYKLQKIKIDD